MATHRFVMFVSRLSRHVKRSLSTSLKDTFIPVKRASEIAEAPAFLPNSSTFKETLANDYRPMTINPDALGTIY